MEHELEEGVDRQENGDKIWYWIEKEEGTKDTSDVSTP
jgi:hypothetical protein